MRRSKVYPLNKREQSINAIGLAVNRNQWTDGASQEVLDEAKQLSVEVDVAKRESILNTIPQLHLVGTPAAVGDHSKPPASSKKGHNTQLPSTTDATSLQQLVNDRPLSALKRLVVMDSEEQQGAASAGGLPVHAEQPATNVIHATGEEGVAEQHEAVNNGSSAEQDLLKYFTELDSDNSEIDLNMVTRILLEGADINAGGINGQTCIHLAARHWQKEVVQFLKEKGANLDEPDDFGVTPLHEAVGVDNEEVVSYLITNNPDVSQVTSDTLQTALHYAVLGNAVNSIYILLEAGADIEAKDHRGRTPLHLAAERDRTAAALVLLSLDKPAMSYTCDDSGHSALISLIQNMPDVTHLALNQLQELVTVKRSQYYYLSALEPAATRGDKVSCNTPLQEIVYWERYELLTHPVISKLLEVKWRKSGWIAFVVHTAFFMIFLAAWTVFISSPVHQYDLPRDWWRIAVLVIAIVMLVQQVAEEVWEYLYSSQQKKAYKKWRTTELTRDLALTRGHPEEIEYLNKEISELDRTNYYFQDEWNFIDIATFITLFIIMITHFVDVTLQDKAQVIGTIHVRISCLAVILIWCRLFKLGRVFPAISPFIAVIRGLIADILRFVVMYIVLFVPFLICFWIIFSSVDNSVQGSEELTRVHRMAFMLFRITLIDDYPYEAMRQEDEVMALILVGTFLFITAVVGLNMFIALLSNTFQRVYDNTLANSEMQRTRLMLQLENVYGYCLIGQKYLSYIHNNCNPLVCTFDDDEILNEQDLRRATLQIRSAVKRVEQQLVSQEALLKEQHETISTLQEQLSSLQLTLNSHFKIPQTQAKVMLPPLKSKRSYPLILTEVQGRLRRSSILHSLNSVQSLQVNNRLKPHGSNHQGSLRWTRTMPEE